MMAGCVLAGLLINTLFGACVWLWLDDDQQSLYDWYCKAPLPVIIQPIVLNCWPIGLFFVLRDRRKE